MKRICLSILALASAIASCSTQTVPVGGLMLVMRTDGSFASSPDQLRVQVTSGDGTKTFRNATYSIPDEVKLPTTLAIASDGDPSDSVVISASLWAGATPLDLRQNEVFQIPTERVVELDVVFSASCSGEVSVSADGTAVSNCSKMSANSTCTPGADGGAGMCVSDVVNGTQLPAFVGDAGVAASPVPSMDGAASDATVAASPETGADGTSTVPMDDAGEADDAAMESGEDAAPAEDAAPMEDAGNPCQSPLSDCGGVCVDLTSAANCGTCGNACVTGSSTPVCALSGGSYTCVSGCPTATPTECSGSCVDTTSSAGNCNGCANVCTTSVANATATCVSSACSYACNAGATACNGGCASFATDNSNCGACGSVCAGTCEGGTCVLAFTYTPSNFAPASYTPPAGATTDCNAIYSSTAGAFIDGSACAGKAPTIYHNVAQTSGPNVDILAFANLTIATGSTLTLTGTNPVILAVYGNATISGTINANANPASPPFPLAETVAVVPGSTSVAFSPSVSLPTLTKLQFATQPGSTYTLQGAVSGTTGTISPAYTGGALTGTATVTPGSSSVTFSASQTLPVGAILVFASEPGTSYVLAGAVSGTSGTLTTPFSGTLPGTAAVTFGSTSVLFTTAQTLPAGTTLQFSSQAGITYTLASAITGSTTGTLTTAYSGSITNLPGTAALEPGGSTVTFTNAQTLPLDAPLVFASQPGATYYLAGAMSASTIGNLTTTAGGSATAVSPGAYTTNGSAVVYLSSGLSTTIPASAAIEVGGFWVGTLGPQCSQGATSCTLVSAASYAVGSPSTADGGVGPLALDYYPAGTVTEYGSAGVTTTLESIVTGTFSEGVATTAIATLPGSASQPGPGGNNATYCSAPAAGGGGGRAVAGGKGEASGLTSCVVEAGGAAHGSSTAVPLLGGCAGAAGSVAAGPGGGGVQVSAAGALAVTGTIEANGGPGLVGTSGGGGGTGGDILLEGASVTHPGTLGANGAGGGPGTAGFGTAGVAGTGGTNNGVSQTAPGNGACGTGFLDPSGGGGGGSYGFIVINVL